MPYTFDVRINACIEPDGTLKVYYASTGPGCDCLDDDSYFDLVINEANWSGGPVSNTIDPCNNTCGADSVTLSVTAARNVGDDIELDVDYSVNCTNTYDDDDNIGTPEVEIGTCTGSTTVTITSAGTCPANLYEC